ncbi:MAG: hypothetical protein ACRD2N_10305 [Vicinamibacterales bacterium]
MRLTNTFDPYGGTDPRELPASSSAEASHYLSIPRNRIGSWVRGRSFAAKDGPRLSPGIIKAADTRRSLLSFVNLLELHVLGAIRREHDIDMRKVRQAVRHLAERFDSAHPLIDDHAVLPSSHRSPITTSQGQQILRSALGGPFTARTCHSVDRSPDCGRRSCAGAA